MEQKTVQRSHCNPKFLRWGKKEDMNAFNFLSSLCNSVCKDAEIVLNLYQKTPEATEIIESTVEKCSWRRSSELFIKRMLKLCKATSFSVRDRKLMRKTANEMRRKKGYIDLKLIALLFPGKSFESVCQTYKKGFKDLST